MRHRKSGKSLGRSASHRKSMFKSMVSSLITHERIQTTHTKAKELRPIIEKVISLGKKNDLHARRLAARVVRDKDALAKLFDELAPRYEERNGGYTRIIKLAPRKGDNAPVSLIELVDSQWEEAASME